MTSSPPAWTEVPGRSFPVFMQTGLFSSFNLKRGLYFALVPLPALAICAQLGQGLLGLALMALGFWPFAFRCRVEREGLRISWLVVNQRLRWDEMRTAAHVADRRRAFLGNVAHVLSIELHDGSSVTLRARPTVLARLAGEISLRK